MIFLIFYFIFSRGWGVDVGVQRGGGVRGGDGVANTILRSERSLEY